MSEAHSTRFEPIVVSGESTVVAEFVPEPGGSADYQSEAQLEHEFIELLRSQAYEFLRISSEEQLVANLRAEKKYTFEHLMEYYEVLSLPSSMPFARRERERERFIRSCSPRCTNS